MLSTIPVVNKAAEQNHAYSSKVESNHSTVDVKVHQAETEAEKLESFKKEIWNQIDSMAWDGRMNISVQITDKAFERMMNDEEFKNKMMKVIGEESVAAHPPGDTSLTWIDENGYKGYSYVDIEAGHSAFAAHSKDKDSFYVKKAKKNQLGKIWEEEQLKKKQQREKINEEYLEDVFQHKLDLTKSKQQDVIASYDKNIRYEG